MKITVDITTETLHYLEEVAYTNNIQASLLARHVLAAWMRDGPPSGCGRERKAGLRAWYDTTKRKANLAYQEEGLIE